LVVVGMRDELEVFLKTAVGGIENTMAGFPDIYMGVLPWSPPSERYRVLSPLNDAVKKTLCRAAVIGASGLLKPASIADIGSNTATFVDHVKTLRALKIPGASLPSGPLCMIFSYVQEPGMKKIGTRKIWFSTPNFGPPPTPQRDKSLVYRGFLGL
ncbi:MAG TPA: hypothetical protein VGZ01_05935, partial [Trinickia sp.]|nr:hypothetical protein [Trinickia sp.]